MTKDDVMKILDYERARAEIINDKQKLLEYYMMKRGISATSNEMERVQTSASNDTVQNKISDEIVQLQADIYALHNQSGKFIGLILNCETLTEKERFAMIHYYSYGMSGDEVAMQEFKKKNNNPHRNTIYKRINAGKDKLIEFYCKKSD